MDSLYILIPIAIIFVAIAAKVFFWAIDNHQFDDLDTEGQRILFDDDVVPSPVVKKSNSHEAETEVAGDPAETPTANKPPC